MPKVTISYSSDLTKIGKTVQVSDDEARELIREGRAVAAKDAPKDAAPKKA